MMLEYTWFFVWALLWAIYFMLDGFDFGVGMAMPFLAKDEGERHRIYSTIEPFWDGNEVWLITAGGVTFAAFPGAYATLFSALYSPLMLILFALILRGAALALRPETESDLGRRVWDALFFLCSFLPSLLFGVAFANLLIGIPIDAHGVFQGTIITLLTPTGLLGGVLFVLLFLMHGALWLSLKGVAKAEGLARGLRIPLMVMLVLFVGYLLATGALSNEALTLVYTVIAVVVMLVPALVLWPLIGKGAWVKAWGVSCAGIVLITLSLIIGMFPAIVPSNLDASFSVMLADAASSKLTLKIMLTVALIMVPIVIAYQTWAYLLFRGEEKA